MSSKGQTPHCISAALAMHDTLEMCIRDRYNTSPSLKFIQLHQCARYRNGTGYGTIDSKIDVYKRQVQISLWQNATMKYS